MTRVIYIALGTNQGDRLSNLKAALKAFSPEIQVNMASPIYETEPWGYANQPLFLKMVVQAVTDLSPIDLLTKLKGLEVDLGRTPTFRYGPRLIDLDILFYDDLVLKTSSLVIPHPRLQERAFVLVPLSDIAPMLVHPVLHRTITELLHAVSRKGVSQYRSAQEGV